jgi:predicted nucleotide-binding protein
VNIFLNYAPEDEFFASTLFVALQAAGYGVVYDASGIAGGKNWNREIRELIDRCDWFVSLLSPDYATSYTAMTELTFALEANKALLAVVVKPIDPASPLLKGTPYKDISTDISDNPRAGIKKVLDFLQSQADVENINRMTPVVKKLAEDIRTVLVAPLPDRIFIAYSRAQRVMARELYDLLVRNGKAVFYDAKIKAGATWRQTIQKALDDATHLIVIWTPDAALSDEVEREVSYGLAERKVIVPLLSREIPKLPYHLHGLHYIVLEDQLSKIESDLLKAIDQYKADEDIWN